MAVEQILSEKGRNTVTITPDRSLAEAAQMLDHHRIGALVVVDEGGAVAGVLSERDVVRAVARGGGSALDAPVSAYMTSKVATCAPSATIGDLMSMMTEGKFRHVPVLVEGRLGGMVSIGDIVKHRLAEMEAEHKALKDYITAG